MALLNFPDNPLDGQLYPNPCPTGTTQYRWDSAVGIWRIVGVATGVTPGTYGDNITVGQFGLDVTGTVTSAANVPIRGASTISSGVVQLTDLLSSTSQNQALTANAGKKLQDQIGNLNNCTVPDRANVVAALNDLQAQTVQLQTDAAIWCGYYNAEAGVISFVSITGQRLGYEIGDRLPLASNKNGGDFFIVTQTGNPYIAGDFNAPQVICETGNWIMSEISVWSEVRALGNLTAADIAYVPSAPLTAINVQNAIFQLQQLLRTPVGGATISPGFPPDPYPGQLWWNNTNNVLYIYSFDVPGGRWVELTTPP
jgi:hypothetical protein